MSITDLILNILIVSIPEEFIMTMCILIVLRQWQFLSKFFWQQNMIRVMIISVIPIAIITNILKFVIKIDDGSQLLISTTLFIIAVSILINVKTIKQFLKVCGFSLIGIALFILTELITAFILKYGLKIDMAHIPLDPLLIFLVAIPERILQYGVLLYIYIRQNSLIQINIINMIKQNKLLQSIIILFTTIDIFITILMLKYIFIENILHSLSLEQQMFIIIIGFSMIILSMLSMWIYVISIFPLEKYKQNKLREELHYEKSKHDE